MGLVLDSQKNFVVTSDYPALTREIRADNAIAHWKLDEALGPIAFDSSGFRRNGLYNNGATLGGSSLVPADPSGSSLGLTDGTGSRASVTYDAWMDHASITVECLVKFSSVFDSTNGDAIVCRYGPGVNSWLVWRNTGGHLAAQIQGGNGTYYNRAAATPAVLGQTYHVAFTFGTGTNFILYVNGTNVASGAVPTSLMRSGSEPIEIGRYSRSNGTTPGAEVDEVAIYNTILSPTRIAAHFAATGL